MPVTIDDSILKAAHLDEQEFKREIAVALFAQDRLTLAPSSSSSPACPTWIFKLFSRGSRNIHDPLRGGGVP